MHRFKSHRLRSGIVFLGVGMFALAFGFAFRSAVYPRLSPASVTADPVTDPTPGTGAGSTSPSQATDPVKCEQLMKSFDDYPLVWLGEDFEGLPLTGCEHVTTAASSYGIPATDHFYIYYGTCRPGDNEHGSCLIPVQVSVEPACSTPIIEDAKKRHFAIRGTAASELYEGSIQIEAPLFKVLIGGSGGNSAGTAQAARAAEVIEGANALASQLTSSDRFSDGSKVKQGKKTSC